MFVFLSAGMLIVTLACLGISLPIGVLLAWLMPGLVNAVQAGVQQYLGIWVWDELIARLLLLRIWVIPGFLTVFFLLAAMAPWLRQGPAEKRLS